jgi:hypothetical protein
MPHHRHSAIAPRTESEAERFYNATVTHRKAHQKANKEYREKHAKAEEHAREVEQLMHTRGGLHFKLYPRLDRYAEKYRRLGKKDIPATTDPQFWRFMLKNPLPDEVGFKDTHRALGEYILTHQKILKARTAHEAAEAVAREHRQIVHGHQQSMEEVARQVGYQLDDMGRRAMNFVTI